MAGFTGHPFYSCKKCRSPVAIPEDLLSKAFWAKSGRAYMFTNAKNIVLGLKEDRKLLTGHYAVANIYCSTCGEDLGWKYIRAYDAREKHKEGRFIIEKAKILKGY